MIIKNETFNIPEKIYCLILIINFLQLFDLLNFWNLSRQFNSNFLQDQAYNYLVNVFHVSFIFYSIFFFLKQKLLYFIFYSDIQFYKYCNKN